MKKPRRNLLTKERFLEGTRQKWCAILLGLGATTMVVQSIGLITDPNAYLGFFTGIGLSFILGASASDVMKIYKVESAAESVHLNEEVNRNETRHEVIKEEVKEERKIIADTKHLVIEEGVNAPEIKPFSACACGDEEEGEYNDFQR